VRPDAAFLPPSTYGREEIENGSTSIKASGWRRRRDAGVIFSVRYAVRQLPGNEQFGGSAKPEAVRLPRSLAQQHAVHVWFSEDGTYVLLEAFRPAAPIEVRNRDVDLV
jgi:hypothetical protein